MAAGIIGFPCGETSGNSPWPGKRNAFRWAGGSVRKMWVPGHHGMGNITGEKDRCHKISFDILRLHN
jgi:hypothetical protein